MMNFFKKSNIKYMLKYIKCFTNQGLLEQIAIASETYGSDKVLKNKIEKDMLKWYVKNGISADEYIKFKLYNKTDIQKQDFISLIELRNLYKNSSKNTFPKSKYDRYLLFKAFFDREIINILFDNTSNENNLYNDFCSRHKEFIVKPANGTKGHGIIKISNTDAPNLKMLAEMVGDKCMLEAVIQQGEELARFHPSSINTIRLVTSMSQNGKFSSIYALLRTGRAGSIVDNVGSGGIISLVNVNKGIVESYGLCNNEYYEAHPDTDINFKNTKIPSWCDLCDLAENAHRTLPDQQLIGWDFAWTSDGKWELVEANPAPSFVSYQTLTGKGIRPLLKDAGIL